MRCWKSAAMVKPFTSASSAERLDEWAAANARRGPRGAPSRSLFLGGAWLATEDRRVGLVDLGRPDELGHDQIVAVVHPRGVVVDEEVVVGIVVTILETELYAVG